MSHYKRGRPKSAARACSCGNKGCKRDGNAHTPLDERREPAPETPRTWPGRKDTKRWCLGHVGREHVLEWRMDERTYLTDWAHLTCLACGKRLDTCWPSRWRREPQHCKCGMHPAGERER